MGDLVRFDSRKRLIVGQAQHEGDAKILMFTGVRYERVVKSTPESTDGGTTRTAVRRKTKP
jgi:hypothetical protein